MDAARITVDEVKAKIAAGESVSFIDIRSPKAYDSSSLIVPGELRIPLDELENRLGEIPRDRTVVAYCT